VIGLLQRVQRAEVCVAGVRIAQIGRGLLVLVAVQRDDGPREVARLAERLLTYRVFPDASGKMNKSVLDERLEMLLVPQFTLAANTRKGTRASFTEAADPETGAALFDKLVAACKERLPDAETGHFGADMQVQLINDGPVTFWLES
jgi:D-tyrosyl-tRNA(Tyr) deacylase